MPFLMPVAVICNVVSQQTDSFELKGVNVISVAQVVAKLKGLSTKTRQAVVAAIQDEY